MSGPFTPARLKVWDAPVRLFHWSLAASFAACLASGFLGRMEWHALAGETVLTLVLFRLAWGFVGGGTARFVSFLRGPAGVIAYLRDHRRHQVGHNPLGGWMVVALLAVLAFQAGLGLMGNDDVLFDGPLSHLVSKEASDAATGLHHLLAWGLMSMVAVHVLAVAAHRLFLGENLLLPMITGRKRLTPGQAAVPLDFASPVRAAVILAGCCLLVWAIVRI